jgi:predicted O-methyltransferase YrrM
VNAYAPVIRADVDLAALVEGAAALFGRTRSDIEELSRRYRAFHEEKDYARTLSELKTVCFEEAFLLGVALETIRPRSVVEIGTQHGKSTRRILDMIAWFGLDCRLVSFDIEDQVRFFRLDEAELVLNDVTGRFREEVLLTRQPQLIFLDAHPYALVKEVITATMAANDCVLAIHDCGPGLCNPRMTLARDDPKITSMTGVWERHVLAEIHGVDDPLSPKLDELATSTYHLRIFQTPHGLAFLVPRGVGASSTRSPASIE